jgi:hypothetical protein
MLIVQIRAGKQGMKASKMMGVCRQCIRFGGLPACVERLVSSCGTEIASTLICTNGTNLFRVRDLSLRSSIIAVIP